jgi:hypothetical protein
MKYPVAKQCHPPYDSTYTLEQNEVWNLPNNCGEIRFDLEMGPMPFCSIRKIHALAVDYKSRTVFGLRSLCDFHDEGYIHRGRVSINGKKYRAFTSSMMFERTDGSLVDVAVLLVSGWEVTK